MEKMNEKARLVMPIEHGVTIEGPADEVKRIAHLIETARRPMTQEAVAQAMAAVLNPANSVVAQTAAAAAAVATSAASNTGASGGAKGPGAPAKVVNVSGDSYTMMVADPGSAVLAAALIADRKAARLDAAMGG